MLVDIHPHYQGVTTSQKRVLATDSPSFVKAHIYKTELARLPTTSETHPLIWWGSLIAPFSSPLPAHERHQTVCLSHRLVWISWPDMLVLSPNQTPSPGREDGRGLAVNNLGVGTTKLYVNKWEDTDLTTQQKTLETKWLQGWQITIYHTIGTSYIIMWDHHVWTSWSHTYE